MSQRRPLPWSASRFLIVVGLALLLYVGVEYGRSYATQHRLQRQWTAQQQPAWTSGQPERLTRISIPKIGFAAIVIEGTSAADLLLGPGHITTTAQPGETGNAVVTAHRDTYFRRLHELARGDVVSAERDGRVYDYEVTGKRIVEPTDLSVIQPSADARLTLITCYPTYYIGPAPNRLVVFTRLSEGRTASSARVATVSK